MAKNFKLDMEPASCKLTAQDVMLVHTVITKALEMNWPFVVVYVIVTAVGWVASYFTSQWYSVSLSVIVAAATLFLGWHMARQIITITHHER